jgi:D-lactate dehydrogenase (cytochrome)
MNRIISVNNDDFDCVVEPGVTSKQLNDYLSDQGLFFSVDPGADASLGGMTSTRASGTRAVRYGTMKDNVLALKVVMSNGELLTTARRARKSSAGYDLTRLFVGAEGTLGIITELTLKLHAIAEATSAGVCRFGTIKGCCDAVIMAVQSGIPIARVELLDEVQVRACNVHSKLSMPEVPTLFVEFHGSPAKQSEHFGQIARECGGGPFEWATESEQKNRLWHSRHDVFGGLKSYRPGAQVVVTDVCVPISRLAECVMATKADIEQSGIAAPIVGHVGDGNFHASVLVMMDDPREVAQARAFVERVAERAFTMEGTSTREHGIGEVKRHFLVPEHGHVAVSAMQAIKQALESAGIMNPGKVF